MDKKPPETEQKPSRENPLEMVCGRLITGGYAGYYHPTTYQDRTIYFCTEFCYEAFLADPDRFYAAHHKKKK